MVIKMRNLLLCLCLALPLPALAAGFAFRDIQGKTQRLEDYRGKWVLVNFWATWCPPCLDEMPDLSALHDAHKDADLVVIGVALDSTRAAVSGYTAKHKVSYPIVMGDYQMADQVGSVEVLPTSYLYAPNGELVSHQVGTVTRESVESYIRQK